MEKPDKLKIIKDHLSASDILREVLFLKESTEFKNIYIALIHLEKYYESSRLVHLRIQETITKIDSENSFQSQGINTLFCEIHFYMICWSRIKKLAEYIRNKTRFRRTGLVLRKYKKELKDRLDVRNHLEHFEERLFGEKNEKMLDIPTDLLNFRCGSISFGGNKVDITDKASELLNSFMAEFQKSLRDDCLEYFKKHAPKSFEIMFKNARTKAISSLSIENFKSKLDRGEKLFKIIENNNRKENITSSKA